MNFQLDYNTMNTEIQKQFVSFEIAVKLKELGFDEPCFASYRSNTSFLGKIDFENCTTEYLKRYEWLKPILAPTYSQAFRWFRQNHSLINCISEQTINSFGFYIDKLGDNKISQFREYTGLKTYEEAEEDCLKKLIEIVKQK